MSRVDNKLLKKYSSTGPRYTSYPPATFFDTSFSNDDYVEKAVYYANNINELDKKNEVEELDELKIIT